MANHDKDRVLGDQDAAFLRNEVHGHEDGRLLQPLEVLPCIRDGLREPEERGFQEDYRR